MASDDLWARADDGAVVRVIVDGGDRPVEVGDWWPPTGLCRVGVESLGVDDRTGATTVRASVDDHRWVERLESALGLFAAERLTGLVAVHAAVIDVGGQRVVLPGPSMVGKSTLAAAALDRGWMVASDEYALVDPTSGTVGGWPRRIRLRGAAGAVRRMPVSATVATTAVVPTLVVVVRHHHDCTGLEVRVMSPGECVLEILANTVCAASRPEFAFGGAVALAERTRAVVGRRGDADGALDALAGLLSSAD